LIIEFPRFRVRRVWRNNSGDIIGSLEGDVVGLVIDSKGLNGGLGIGWIIDNVVGNDPVGKELVFPDGERYSSYKFADLVFWTQGNDYFGLVARGSSISGLLVGDDYLVICVNKNVKRNDSMFSKLEVFDCDVDYDWFLVSPDYRSCTFKIYDVINGKRTLKFNSACSFVEWMVKLYKVNS